MIDWGTMIGLLIGFSSLAVSVFFSLRGFRSEIVNKLSHIESRMEPIKKLEETVIRIDERTPLGGTVEGFLKNLGKVKVTAESGDKRTRYTIQIEKPVLKGDLISLKSKETGFEEKIEKNLFAGMVPTYSVITPSLIAVYVPSADPKICSEYITKFLKWLDSEYWEALKEDLKKFENITF